MRIHSMYVSEHIYIHDMYVCIRAYTYIRVYAYMKPVTSWVAMQQHFGYEILCKHEYTRAVVLYVYMYVCMYYTYIYVHLNDILHAFENI